jgi:hypothetical protein
MKYVLALFLLSFLLLVPLSHADYIVTGINTTMSLNLNASAQVVEIFKVSVTNTSVSQYTTDRLALNFTLSQWQNIIGPSLVEHIVNPRGSVYNFNFIPGPITSSNNGKLATLILSYTASNVTTVNQTGPRVFLYKFNNAVLNYQNAESGEVLGQNTSLTIILPPNSRILTAFPNPDFPVLGFTKNYQNVTTLSWSSDEPLSKFTLNYDVQQSLQNEVTEFFSSAYGYLGNFIYLIIIVVIALIIFYAYLKSEK